MYECLCGICKMIFLSPNKREVVCEGCRIGEA